MTRHTPRRGRRFVGAIVTAVVAAGLLTQPVAAAPATPGGGPAPASDGRPQHTVTLLTGDVVRVTDVGSGHHAVDVVRARGARGGVRTETVGDHLYVWPDEVLPYVASGVLDRRLFDVTGLIAQGYDDAHSDGLPLIVGYGGAATARAAAPATPPGATRVRTLPSINGAAMRADKKRVREVWTSTRPRLAGTIDKIWLDGKVRPAMAASAAQIGAPEAWAAGYDGAGVRVAVLDSGADLNHPDLAGRIKESASFVPGETVQDGNGHGTHVASTVGGSGAASDGAEKGIAYGAELLVGKVLGDGGFGEDSWVIAGMEWAAAQDADVVNMSLGGTMPTDGTDPMSVALDRLTADTGTLFVVAAGNTASEASMSPPGAANSALTVGAVDADDNLAWFSSRGPRFGDYALKPDISAPGVGILAAKAGGTAETGWYTELEGTSMASPHVAGAAALLAQQHPDWPPARLKDALMSTSHELTGLDAYAAGAGRLDVAAAVRSTLTATGSTYFGYGAWPHGDAAPVERTVTYANAGDAAVTLDLSMTAAVAGGAYDVDPTADAGTPAPAGMFALSATSVTVPAGATASVTVTAQPALGADGRRYLGEIIAARDGGGERVRTQFGLYLEDERHDLDIAIRDRSGRPLPGYVQLQKLGEVGDPLLVLIDESGRQTVRLRAGTYSALTYVEVAGSKGPDSVATALLGDPEIVLDRDRALNLDARKAVEATAQVPRRTEDRVLAMNWYRAAGEGSAVDSQYLLPPYVDSMFVLPTKRVKTGDFEYETRWRKAYPLLTLTHRGAPVSVMPQAGSPFYAGKGGLTAVYAGTGAPEEYAGLRAAGRAVLVTRSDAVPAAQRAAAAAAAGAVLLIVVNDGPGKLLEWYGGDDGSDSPVPVVTVTAREGAPLVAAARGTARLGVEGVPNSPYVYDLVDPHPGRIPADLRYRPRASDLATIDSRFGGDRTRPSGEYRWNFRPYRPHAVGYWLKVDMPGTRVDYVSAQPGTSWAESAVTGPELSWVSSADIHAYRPGSRQTVRWFQPVVRPRNGGGFWSSTRHETYIEFNVQPWADGDGEHAGYQTTGDSLRFEVSANGQSLKVVEGWASTYLEEVPAETVTYTLDLRASRDPAVYAHSTRTHTTWQVVSPPVANPDDLDLMALLQLDYDVDTDLAGAARGGRQEVRLRASHLAGARGAGAIRGATFEVSYDDGATWRSVPLDRTAAGGWTARFSAPRSGAVSTRTTAWDAAGNRITQEVIRAYGLR